MRVITPEQLPSVLATLPANPRIIASGNFATPNILLNAADENLEKFILHMAACFGQSQSQQAKNLIEKAAHPDAREHLSAAAREMKLI